MEDNKLSLLLKENKADFASWAAFVTEVEEASYDDIGMLSSVYEAFLSKFPLCYIYWIMYAYHKARLCGIDDAVEVYEQAVNMATYSVDLWANYCSFAVQCYEDPEDVRRLFERGLSFVGKDYSCHILWDGYIEFEYSLKHWGNLAHLYIKALRFPSKKLHCYYKHLKKLIVIWEEEMELPDNDMLPSEAGLECEVTESKVYRDSEISEIISRLLVESSDKLKPYMMKKYIALGEDLYSKSSQLYKSISCFENAIHIPNFHAKSLGDDQIENWHNYLDFVEIQGDFDWIVKLYERCLIPCANYQEFWIRYAEHMEAKGGREIAFMSLQRASKYFLKGEISFNLYSARFKERMGDNFGANSSFLLCQSDSSQNLVENVTREANMEKRLGNVEAASSIYEKAILMAEEKHDLQLISILYIHFARFTFVVTGSIDSANEIFAKAILKYPPSKSLLEELIQFVIMHGGHGQINYVSNIVASSLTPQPGVSETLSLTDRMDISRLFIEFVDLYGTISEIENAWCLHRKLFPHLLRPDFSCGPSIGVNGTSENQNNVSNIEANPPSYSPHGKLDPPDIDNASNGFNDVNDENLARQNSNNSSEAQDHTCSDSPIGIGHNLEKLSMNSLAVEKQKCQTASSLIFNAPGNEKKKFSDNEISYNTESNEAHLKSSMPAYTHPQMAYGHVTANLTPACTQTSLPQEELHLQKKYPDFPESQEADTQSSILDSDHPKMDPNNATSHAQSLLPAKLQEERHPEQVIPFTGSHFYNGVSGVSSSQIHCVSQNLASSVLANPGSAQLEFPPGANLQMLNTHGYKSEQQVWQEQYQQYCQEQSQCAMAVSQGDKSATSPYIQPNLHQQGFHPSYQFQSMVSPSEAQVYQNLPQSNEQYSCFQYGQGFPSQMWYYYYQQQFYHLQLLQQQNLLLQQQKLQMQQKQNTGDMSQPHKSSPLHQGHGQEGHNLPHKEHLHQQESKQTQNLELEQHQQQQFHQNIQHYQSELQTFEEFLRTQQQQQTSQQLQHQQLQFQKQQQLLLHQAHLQQKQPEHPHHDHQMPITPLDIQVLSEKYLQGQGVASENIQQHNGASCSSSHPPSSQEQ